MDRKEKKDMATSSLMVYLNWISFRKDPISRKEALKFFVRIYFRESGENFAIASLQPDDENTLFVLIFVADNGTYIVYFLRNTIV